MDILDEEVLRLWSSFEKNQLRYLMVGGFAANLHGHFRTTGDLDVWIEDSVENRKKLRTCLAELEVGDFASIEKMEFIPGWSSINLPNGIELDLMTYLRGFPQEEFSNCLKMASYAEINGIRIPFLHINHLISEKQLLQRPKDLIDVEALEKIKKLKES